AGLLVRSAPVSACQWARVGSAWAHARRGLKGSAVAPSAPPSRKRWRLEERFRCGTASPPVAVREYNRAAESPWTVAGGLNGADRHRREQADRKRGPPHLRQLHRAPRPVHLRRYLRGGLAAERRRGIPPRRARRGPSAPRPGAPVAGRQLRE